MFSTYHSISLLVSIFHSSKSFISQYTLKNNEMELGYGQGGKCSFKCSSGPASFLLPGLKMPLHFGTCISGDVALCWYRCFKVKAEEKLIP